MLPTCKMLLVLLASWVLFSPASLLASVAEPFEPPVGGWTTVVEEGKGSFSGLRLPGMEHMGSRGWVSLGVPDRTGGGPMYTPRKAWPLVVVLHGSNGNGNQLAGVFRGSLKQFGAISVYPTTVIQDPMLAWNQPYEMANVMHVVREISRIYHIDPQRIHLIGHSMGGGGTYAIGSQTTPIWTSLGPMAGWWQTAGPNASRLRNIPIRILHGVNDGPVPISQGDAAFNAITNAGNTNIIFDRIAGADHNDILFKGGQLTEHVFNMEQWLMAQVKPYPPDFEAAEAMVEGYGAPIKWFTGHTPIGHFTSHPGSDPTIDSLSAPTNVKIGEVAQFSVIASHPDGDTALAAYWDFGDGEDAWGDATSHIFREPGPIEVTLRVCDLYNGVATQTVTVTVEAASPGEPPAITSPNTARGSVGQPFHYQISASQSPSLFHARHLPRGFYCDPQLGDISCTDPAEGVYVVQLRAFNGAGSGHQELTITIGEDDGQRRVITMRNLAEHSWHCQPEGAEPVQAGDETSFGDLQPGNSHLLSCQASSNN